MAAAGLMAAGTGASLFGQSQKDKATKKALAEYRRAQAIKAAADREAWIGEGNFYAGEATDRQNGVGGYIRDLELAEQPGTDDGFQTRQTGMMTDLSNATADADGNMMYEGAPASQAQAMQDTRTGADNASAARAMLTDYTDRQIDERQKGAATRMSLADLLRGSRGKSMAQRFQLARALRELDWQHQTRGLQNNLDRAGRKGATMQMLGGLATSLGSMGMGYGGANSGGGSVTASGGDGMPMMDPQDPGRW
jgi:hypothetical protein